MDETEQTITITFPVKQAAQRHIEELQSTLTKRNETIERLTAQLEEALAGEPNQSAQKSIYKRGWRDAANLLMSTTQEAAAALGKVRKDAWEIYLKSEGRDF